MCRLAAYLGAPIFLDELIVKPRHSLMRQALCADMAKVQTHGDGFGIGWYGERAEPGVYRDATPAWADDNLLALAHTLRSALFFAHVRAATAGASARQNCHPFRHGRFLFMHNGHVGGYATLRRTMESWLPDDLFAARSGATDSELLFLLALARHHKGQTLPDAMLSVLDDTATLMQRQGVQAPLRFTAVLADGERLYAFRMASDGQPPTLYLRRCTQGTLIASEPLGEELAAGEPDWQAVPVGTVVTLDAAGCRMVAAPAAHAALTESAA